LLFNVHMFVEFPKLMAPHIFKNVTPLHQGRCTNSGTYHTCKEVLLGEQKLN
jgi:hypothetical protein